MNCTPLDQPLQNGSLLLDVNMSAINDTYIANDMNNATIFSTDLTMYDRVEYILYHYVLPVICCFGILGNILNLMILSRKSLTVHMERLEKCAHSHLIALAVSDLMYCVTFLPHTFMPIFIHASYMSPLVLYDAYHTVVINTFLLFSSWLTVAMAVSRYIAICHPVRARQHLGIIASRMDIGIIFIFSVLFNVPRYFTKTIHKMACQEGGYSYFTIPGALHRHPNAEFIYQWIYFVVGIIIPLIAVAYCNIYFIRALQSSRNLRRHHSSHGQEKTSLPSNLPRILTLTLSIIVVLYLLLVIPAEIIMFFKDYVIKHFQHSGNKIVIARYSLAAAICNNMQIFNFAVNFLLYCMINVHFRQVIKNAFCCKAAKPNHRRSITWSERSTMLSSTATTMM